MHLTIAQELLSEESIYMSTQRSSTSTLSTSLGPSYPSTGGSKCKPRFAEFACPFVEVYRFAVVVTKAVIPKNFWGGNENFRLVMSISSHIGAMRLYLYIKFCGVSARQAASGQRLATLPRPIPPFLIVSNDANS
ncbi:hypothetical protein EDB87DRAFT_73713 [Lactarius vividus]|nr:hypothetical protein EDB87DRAFT_73713 [Lactarius vividus]